MITKRFTLSLSLLTVLGGLATVQADCQLYTDHDYTGMSINMPSGQQINALGKNWNDQISSVHLSNGSSLIAYLHVDFAGDQREFSANTRYVGDLWNDQISSLKCTNPDAADRCKLGYVWREASPSDHVCVLPKTRSDTTQENALAPERRNPSGGAYGADTCRQGYVWREAFAGDHVCVTPASRARAAQDNAANAKG